MLELRSIKTYMKAEVTGAAFSTDSGEGLDVLGDATVTGSATVNNNASASSTTGDATASEEVSNTTGLIDDLMVGGDATVEEPQTSQDLLLHPPLMVMQTHKVATPPSSAVKVMLLATPLWKR